MLREKQKDDSHVHIVTSDDVECTTVAGSIEGLIPDKYSSEMIIVCTLAGIERVSKSTLLKAIDEQIPLILNELPNLFVTYRHSFTSENVQILERFITIKDGTPYIKNISPYDNESRDKSFNDNLNKLLELVPKGTVRFQERESGGWTVFGYELKENLNQIMSLCKSVYLLAEIARGTLDHVILGDVWGYGIETVVSFHTHVRLIKFTT